MSALSEQYRAAHIEAYDAKQRYIKASRNHRVSDKDVADLFELWDLAAERERDLAGQLQRETAELERREVKR